MPGCEHGDCADALEGHVDERLVQEAPECCLGVFEVREDAAAVESPEDDPPQPAVHRRRAEHRRAEQHPSLVQRRGDVPDGRRLPLGTVDAVQHEVQRCRLERARER
jgi:hypothetical protein